MIKVSVLYPNTPGSRFDVDYYTSIHMPMSVRLLGSALKDVSVEIGIGSAVPGDPAPFAAIAGLTCESVEAFTAAFMPVADQLQEDIPKYTDIRPILQISELKKI